MTQELERVAEAIAKQYPWYAVDEDGVEWIYTSEPRLHSNTWQQSGNSDCLDIGTSDMDGVDWRKTKEKIW